MSSYEVVLDHGQGLGRASVKAEMCLWEILRAKASVEEMAGDGLNETLAWRTLTWPKED